MLVYSHADSRFQRRGPDLWRAETIDVVDAVLGTTRTFPSLDGKLKVKIPPGSQPDEILRLKGKGLPRFCGRGRGDLNVRIHLHVPQVLSKKERQLYEQPRKLTIVDQ